jgi:ATP-dependent DNA helicase PIF1
MTQSEALAVLKTGANVFLTGEPGSGKTHTINQYIAYLRACDIEPSITASTGIAATHIGGVTIHSWSGIGVRHTLTKYDIDRIGQNKNVVERVGSTRILIIDEVSMLSSETLSMVDAVCREIRRSSEAFGGLQVILVGDFFQLPPIARSSVSRQEAATQAEFTYDTGGDIFAYHSSTWEKLNPIVCYLSEQHRQEDAQFLEFLTSMREGTVKESHKQLLRTRYSKVPKDGITQLYSHNENVDDINSKELNKLSIKAVKFEMTSRGPEKLVSALKRGCLSPETLALKVGARVMFTKNDVIRHKYVNGTLGTVIGFSKENGCPIVKTHSGTTVFAETAEWHIEDAGRILARIIQVPLRLAWAITVHKSQGMSLDSAHMDLSAVFEYGQGYVALSRVRTLEGLYLAGLNNKALEVHPSVSDRDAEFRSISDTAQEQFATIDADELKTMQVNFVKACGGKVPTGKDSVARTKAEPVDVTLKKRVSKGVTQKETRSLVYSGMSVQEVARKLGRTEGTIVKHLEELRKEGLLQKEKCVHLRKGNEKIFAGLENVFEKVGTERLKPVYDETNGRIPYDTIRIARLFFG